MTLGKKIIICGVLAIALNLATAVAGGSNWRWAVFGGTSLATVGWVIWMLRILQTTLLRCVGELLKGTREVAGAAEQVSSASQSLAQGASEQAATLEETSASSQELSSMSQNSADNARSAAEVMRESERLVDSANNTLAEMVTSMTEINNASDKIARIIKVIDEIAFQTNILALNAAVEAARAGEAGKGFAVVADEVRNLAQRSAQAAKDTAGIIEESISKSKEGGKRLDQVKDAISAITESSTKVKALVDEVSVGSQEQAQGFSEITNSIGQMERVTQQAAASAEQSASASAQLSAQAKSMEDAVRFLQSLVQSEDEAPAPAKASAPSKQRLSVAPARRREQPVAVPDDLEEAFPMDDDFR